jgi:DsbC/DsbD-like thiol-disulfide interchange protein
MKKMYHILTALALTASFGAVAPSFAQPDVFEVELREGWQMKNGSQMIAFHLALRDGWKTYWRAPGDNGIPPIFDWAGSRNVASVRFHWPRPEVFELGGGWPSATAMNWCCQ